jgi:hypothetical protein
VGGSIVKRVVLGLALALLWWPASAVAQAEKPQKSDFSFSVGARTWISTGYSTDKVQGGGIDPVSVLRWRGVDSIVPEVNADLVWKRLVLMGNVGWGAIDQGVLIDEDYLLSDQMGRFSRTRSDVTDDGLFYVTGDIGWRVFRWEDEKRGPGFFDLFIGYSYWHEKYVAYGITSGFPGVVPPIGTNVKVITQDYFWHSLRIGVREEAPLLWGIRLKGKLVLIPYSWFELNDVHHLRSDLRKNPSFRDEAEGGFGLEVDGALTTTIWKGLSVEAGYRYWGIRSATGDAFTRRLCCGVAKDILNEDSTERHGPYFGLLYRF